MYIVCRLRPDTFEIQADTNELGACKWVEVRALFVLHR